MKWYSKNSVDGCVPISSLPFSVGDYYKSSYAWLIIKRQNGFYDFAHGSG